MGVGRQGSTATERSRCGVCGAATWHGLRDCYCCRTLVAQLGVPLVPVVAICDVAVGEPLHRLLWGYKDDPSTARRELRVCALARFVEAWLSSGVRPLPPWDVVAVVPSTQGRHDPAEGIVRRVPRLRHGHLRLLERGPTPTGHLRAARSGFVLSAGVDWTAVGRGRVLLFDDCLTTGARAQSAAFALRRAGFGVVSILVVGKLRRRKVDPSAAGG